MKGILKKAAARLRPRPGSRIESAVIPGTDIACTLRRSARRTLSLTIRPDLSITVGAPLGTSDAAIAAFLSSRLPWIREKLAFLGEHRGRAAEFTEGSEIPHLGTMRRILPVPPSRGSAVRVLSGTLEIPCSDAAPESVRKSYLAWRLPEAKRLLAPLLSELDSRACLLLGDGRHFSSLTVRSLKSRWGSCSAGGSIVLASQLMELPPELAEYVIMHELCHLRRMDHSPQFHRLLRRLLPDASEREAAIRTWSLEHPRIL